MKTAGLAVSLIIVAAVVGIVLLNLLESSGDDSKPNRTLNDTSQPFPAPTATLATAPELETTSQPVFTPSSPRQGDQLLDELPAALAAVPVPSSLDGEEESSPLTPDIDTTESEVQIRVNSFRGEQGLTQLALNVLLVEVARAHSKDMAQRKFFDHYTPEGLGPQDRVERAGITDLRCAENLFQVLNGREISSEYISKESFNGWVNSPSHYDNMIGPSYDTGAVGIHIVSTTILDIPGRRHDIYVTHLLCQDFSEYNRLKAEYDIALILFEELDRRFEELSIEYQRFEALYLANQIPIAELEEKINELEEATSRRNSQVGVVNGLVTRLNEILDR